MLCPLRRVPFALPSHVTPCVQHRSPTPPTPALGKQGERAHDGAGAHVNGEGKGVVTHSPPIRVRAHPPPRVSVPPSLCACAPLPVCMHAPSLFVCVPPPHLHACPLPVHVRTPTSRPCAPPPPHSRAPRLVVWAPPPLVCVGRGGEGGSSRWVLHSNGGTCGLPHLWAPQRQGVGTPFPYPSAYTRGRKGGLRASYPIGHNWGGAGGEGGGCSSGWELHSNGGTCSPPHPWAPQRQGGGMPFPNPTHPCTLLVCTRGWGRGGKGGWGIGPCAP
jgi:hypothetical protein